ncbi:MFS transporter [Nocardia gipuzkoensis]
MAVGTLVPLRRNTQFQLLWFGSAASALGSNVSALAYPLLVLAITGSPGLAGLVAAVGFATGLLFALPGGVWGDRWDRRWLLISCELVRAAAVCTVVLAGLVDHLGLAHIMVAAAIIGGAGALFNPAREVAIRSVVRPEQLTLAYSQEHARLHAATLAGPPLAGLLFSWGRLFPFALDTITYLISAVLIACARVPRGVGDSAPTVRRSMRAEMAEAARWLWNQRLLRAICLLTLVFNLGSSTLLVPIIVLVQERGGSSAAVGIVMGALGFGGLIGATLAARVTNLLPVNHLLLAICAVDAVLLLIIVAPVGPYWPVLPMLLAGVSGPLFSIPLQVQVARRTPQAMMARVQSMIGLAASALMPIGPIIGGVGTESVGATRTIMTVAGLFAACCACGLYSPTLRRKQLSELDDGRSPSGNGARR